MTDKLKPCPFCGGDANAVDEFTVLGQESIARFEAKKLATAEADLANAKQSLDEAREVIEKLVEALDRAHDDMAAWQGYAGEYFLNKHGADDDLQAIKDALQSALTWLAATYPDSAFMEGK